VRNVVKLVVCGVAVAAAVAASAGGAVASQGSTFTDDPVSLGMTGVSPHVERTAAGDRVWRSDGPAGTNVSLCTDAGACTPETLSVGGGPVSDFAVAQSPSGLRAYFKRMVPGGTQSVQSAPCTDANCLSVGSSTLASPEMQVPSGTKAWGVPDPVLLPDGRVRIYIVESPVPGGCTEKVASYTSADGVSFTKDAGWRLEGGYVDTEMLRARDGDWLMIVADGPGCGPTQRLYLTQSTDGLAWSKPVALTGSDRSRLDPAGYEVAPNVFRIYFAASAGRMDMNFTIGRGTLRVAAAAPAAAPKAGAACTKAGAKAKVGKSTLTCKRAKGKLTWSR
jgi:hypothetical protein